MKGKRPSVHYKKSWARVGLLMSLPAILSIATFVVIPLFMNIGYSLTDYSVSSIVPRFVGLNNFRSIINDMNFKLVIKNTIQLALLYVIGLNTLAIFISVLIVRVSRELGNFVKSILYFPCLLAMVVVGFIWRILFNYTHGIINKALMLIGIPESAVPEWLGDPKMIILSIGITIIWYALGYYVVIYYAGLMAIPIELYEVSNIEGANKWQEFLYVTLPLLAPSITINVVLTSMAIIGSFDLPYTLTNGGGPGKYGTTLPVWIYQTYFHDYQYGKALAQAVMLTGVAIVIAVIELKILLKREVRS
jgi:multiple sugar transport system permease protein